MVSKGEYEAAEAGLNTLIDAIHREGGSQELARRVFEAAESVHYEKVSGDNELFELLGSVVKATKPPVLSTAWEEAWGNLFSHLIQLILSSESGPGIIISHLFGPDPVPEAAEKECVLCVNPGSTSTKVALYRGLNLEAAEEVHLPPDYEDTIENRTEVIVNWMERCGITCGDLTGIACRGGFVKPVPTGTYVVSEEMIRDLQEPRIEHASNMAIPIGLHLRNRFMKQAEPLITTTDPVASDEILPAARLTGIQRILRDGSGAHYLNHNAVHTLVCSLLGRTSKELTTIGAHLGGGISILRHSGGLVVDLVNAFSGIPSANRSGNIPLDCLLDAINERKISLAELERYLFRQGGLIDLTGTNDFRALLHFRDTGAVQRQREKIELIVEFMARNVAGSIMRLAAVEGKIDVVILAGGISQNSEFTGRVKRKVFPCFPVVVVPGSIEHEALVAGHMRARFLPGMRKDYVEERDALYRRRYDERELLETEVFVRPHLRRKENAPVRSLDELVYLSRSLVSKHRTPRIAIVGAENEDAVAAAKQANEDGHFPVAKFLLVGDYYDINMLAWDYDIKVDNDNYTIVDSDDPVARSCQLLAAGQADLLMKGGVKTEEIMRGAIKYLKESGRMRKGCIYSHVGCFQIPTYTKLLLVTDAALIPNPDQDTKKKILENALTVCGYLNIKKPKVAIISAVETRNPSVESSILAGELADHYAARDDCIVEGPLSLDIAMDPRSAQEKHYTGRIRGNADILLMPDIEAGNVVYKSLTVASGAYLAGVIVGAGVPIVLTSRGDSAHSKLASICLASIVAMKQGDLIPGDSRKR
jgi:phosphate butyryltransferase